MSTIQLSFSLRVSSGVKTVHLLGSWDGYVGQLPLSKDSKSSKSGSWKGTFRFPGNTLEAGQRYWYYYIIDGYHTSHNPSEKSTTEPTTGRELNVLDVPKVKSSSSSSSKHSSSSSSSSSHKSSSHSSSRHSSKDKSRHSHVEVPKGRPLSVSQIKSPKPHSPHATRHILTDDYDVDELAEHLAKSGIDEADYDEAAVGIVYGDDYAGEDAYITADMGVLSGSPLSSSGSDLSYSSDDSSSQGAYSSVSGYSTPSSDYSSCTCERYGITRKGDRVRIDCGGARCGYEDSCSSSEDEEYVEHSSRRNGIVVAA
ncbi:GTP-binding protein [Grosmannia clavigera kw1407]|uniref:GTP-binding protein n=1 Tax=Grosmannia clavigera (strain kw1407 / UAMH 11150) TaxID=655863 RepID=F0XDK2_GROCL|nr:GTP-binding protein [Grosmannia clavigera kw1407]EFX04497.1 GTP-binding protein [Grosmannia clavigera kw1407]